MGRTKTKTADQPSLVIDNDKAAVPAVQKEGQQVAAVAPGPDSLFAIIERAARDPSIDLQRMQELISMHKELKADNARAEYDAAMAEAQSEMKTIRTNKKNDHTKSKYADYEAMDRAIRPIYTKYGFAMSFNSGDAAKPDEVRILLTISHRGGHRQEYRMDIPADGKGPRGDNVMTRTHATSSAATYGKRILAGMAWNISVGNDDDGNDAASDAERAKIMADKGITHLNSMQPPTKEALAKWDAENAKAIAWLKKNSPEEFARYQTAYSNAAEAAGIKKEEPKRGGNNQSSTTASPHSGTGKDGQPEAPSGAGGDSKSEAASKPGPVTDAVDLNDAPLTFETYTRAGDFFIFADAWIGDAKRTEAELVAFGAFYADYINERLDKNFKSKSVREAMIDTDGRLKKALTRFKAK